MGDSKFDPRLKKFVYEFFDSECCYIKNGKCPTSNSSLEELKTNTYKPDNDKSSENYCKRIANLILSNGYIEDLYPVYIVLHERCGHYTIDNGRHRTCVIAHLLNEGASVNFLPSVTINRTFCPHCGEAKRGVLRLFMRGTNRVHKHFVDFK